MKFSYRVYCMVNSYFNSQWVSKIKAVRSGVDTQKGSEVRGRPRAHSPATRGGGTTKEPGLMGKPGGVPESEAPGVSHLLGCQRQVHLQSNFPISSWCLHLVVRCQAKRSMEKSLDLLGKQGVQRNVANTPAHCGLKKLRIPAEDAAPPARSTRCQDKAVQVAPAPGVRGWPAGPPGQMRGADTPGRQTSACKDSETEKAQHGQKVSRPKESKGEVRLTKAQSQSGADRCSGHVVAPSAPARQSLSLLILPWSLQLICPPHTRPGETPTPRA